MSKLVIGYLFSGNYGKDEKIFQELAESKDVELVIFNISNSINEKEFEDKIKRCDVVYNATADDYSIMFKKTIEHLGVKVMESSDTYYYTEDKWMFYMKCKENEIATPETILLSTNINVAKWELKTFNKWPVILKRTFGTMGEFVEKCDNLEQAEEVIYKFWKKGTERQPIIAQEFINSPCYRVTCIGNKIMQAVIKNNNGWKATGVYAKNFARFEVDKELENLIKMVMRATKIKIGGIDLLKKDGQWMVLEANSEPAFDFIEEEREKLINNALDFLISVAARINNRNGNGNNHEAQVAVLNNA